VSLVAVATVPAPDDLLVTSNRMLLRVDPKDFASELLAGMGRWLPYA
jgi:hypothetical protein